ncbi:MAG: helicase [Chloroflexota bacterium]
MLAKLGITRTVHVGGRTKSELMQALQRNSIMLNASAERLFSCEQFTTSETRYPLTTVELTVCDLGFPEGATIAEIYGRVSELGLALCPLELGPHLRLQYLDQPEGQRGSPVRRHQAPYGSITIASEKLTEDDDFPKGFYLRRIEGVLWLRGYRSGPEHVWMPDDHFIITR